MSTKKFCRKIEVYTDGSFSKSKSGIKAGYGIHFPNGELKDVSRKFTHEPITNQRAELYAIYKAIKLVTTNYDFDKLNIYSDSKYSIDSLTVWIKNWKLNGWMTSNKKEVLNQDIIKKTDALLQNYKKND